MRKYRSHKFIPLSNSILCLSLVFAATAIHAQIATFQLHNGDRITGSIINESTSRVVISNAWSKEIIIPLSEIKSRDIIATNAVAATNAPAMAKTNAPVVAKPAPAPKPVPAKTEPVVAAKPVVKPKPKFLDDWHGDVQIGADVGLGETTRELYHAQFKITYAPVQQGGPGGSSRIIERFRNIFDYNAAYGTVTSKEGDGKSETALAANRMDGSSKTDFDLGTKRRIFVYNLVGAGYDEIRHIDRRYEVGPGLGYHLFTRSNFVMNAEAGMNYQAQYFQNDTKSERIYYRFAEDINWKISKMLTFDEKFEIFPEVHFDQYRMRFESNLRYWLLKNISFNLTVLDTYDTQVAPHIDKNDLQIRSSIGLKF
jgi:hypothetical protein